MSGEMRQRKQGEKRKVPKTRLAFQTLVSEVAYKQATDYAGNHIVNTCLHTVAFGLTKLVNSHFIKSLTEA